MASNQIDLNELLSFTLKAVKELEGRGVSEAEAYASQIRMVSIGLENNQLVRARSVVEEGIGIRISIGGRIGFAYTSRLEAESVSRTAEKALKLAKAGRPDPRWAGFPEPETIPKVSETYDEEVAEVGVEEAVRLASEMLDSALKTDGRVRVSEGALVFWTVGRAVANSLGVEASEAGTWAECFTSTVAKEAGETTPSCFEFDASRRFRLDLKRVGAEAARLAISALNAGKAEDGKYTVILGQSALLDLLIHTLIPALKADNVHRGKSPLKGRIGEKIASEVLTIIDEGLRAGGLSTWSFDDEGSPSRDTPIIVRGVLKGFLYDHYYASIDGCRSSGNARRGFASYASTPRIEPTNFKIEASQKSPETLMAEVDRGFYIPFLQGAHSSNPESGEFSVVAAPAWKIEGGSLTRPIRALMLTGNIYELLENVSGTASNLRDIGVLVAPWVRFENVGVVGG